MIEKFVNNGEVRIQYLVVDYSPDKTPLVIIPGAIDGADDFYESIKADVNFYCIIISLRGRGKSTAPQSRYSIDDQISDIETVIKEENLSEFYVLGHSVGGGLAAYYAIKYTERIKGLIIADYLPAYPKFSEKWAERIRSNYREDEISSNFIFGIVRDAEKRDFTEVLGKCPFKKLFLKAGKEDSLLPLNKANEILRSLTNTSLKIIDDCGHEMFLEKPQEVLKIIEKFIY